jgi:hypothetical protein
MCELFFVMLLLPPVSKHIAITIRSNSCINRHEENIFFVDELIFSLSFFSLSLKIYRQVNSNGSFIQEVHCKLCRRPKILREC